MLTTESLTLDHFRNAAAAAGETQSMLHVTRNDNGFVITSSPLTFDNRSVTVLEDVGTAPTSTAGQTADSLTQAEFLKALGNAVGAPLAEAIEQQFLTENGLARPLTNRLVSEIDGFLQEAGASFYEREARQIEHQLSQLDELGEEALPWLENCAENYAKWRDSFHPDAARLMAALKKAREAYFERDLASCPENIARLIRDAMKNDERELVLQGNQPDMALPRCVGYLHKLRTLHIDNLVTSLPESLGKLLDLRMLTLSRNRLETLPESLCHLPHLHTLSVDNNQLQFLPNSIDGLTALRGLSARNNQLSTLPYGIILLPGCRINVSNNPFTENVISNINDAVEQLDARVRPIITFSQIPPRPNVVVKPFDQEVRSWYNESHKPVSEGELDVLRALDDHEQDRFSTFFGGLRRTQDYMGRPESRRLLQQRAIAVIDYLIAHPPAANRGLYDACRNTIVATLNTCDDGSRIGLALVQSRIIEHRAVKEGWPLEKLKETGKEYWRLSALQNIADRKFQSQGGFGDYTEVELKFLVQWPDKQNLPESHRIEEMIFHRLAGVSDQEITAGFQEVANKEASGEWLLYLANDWGPTKNKVDSRYKKELAEKDAELTAASYPKMEKLEKERQEQMAVLETEKQTRQAGSSPMPEQEYTQRTRDIQKRYDTGAAAVQKDIDQGVREYRGTLMRQIFESGGVSI